MAPLNRGDRDSPEVGDDWEVSTATITRVARDASGEVHDRMPAFLTADVYDEWLHPGKLDGGQVDHMLELLKSTSAAVASMITTYEVDRKVNNSCTADPSDASLIEPLSA